MEKVLWGVWVLLIIFELLIWLMWRGDAEDGSLAWNVCNGLSRGVGALV